MGSPFAKLTRESFVEVFALGDLCVEVLLSMKLEEGGGGSGAGKERIRQPELKVMANSKKSRFTESSRPAT